MLFNLGHKINIKNYTKNPKKTPTTQQQQQQQQNTPLVGADRSTY